MNKTVAFSYSATKLGLVSSAIGVAIVMILVVVFGLNPNHPIKGEFNSTEYPASLDSLAYGCGNDFVFNPDHTQYGVIPEKMFKQNKVINIPLAPMIVPVYGYMTSTSLPDSAIKFYPKGMPKTPLLNIQLLRTMYSEKTIIVWYASTIAQADYVALQKYVSTHKNVLAIEWHDGSQQLPLNRKVAFSTWGISQSCQYFSPTVLKHFTHFVITHNVARPSSPPVTKLDKNGMLPNIQKKIKSS